MSKNSAALFFCVLVCRISLATGEDPKLALWEELTGQKKNPERSQITDQQLRSWSDLELYSRALSSYQLRNEPELSACVHELKKRFSKSPYTDDAIFFLGQLALESKDYARALENFQEISKVYPQSNRMVSAQFSKGQAYKKMNLNDLARRTFQEVRMRYPGSPESLRSELAFSDP